MPGRGGRVVLAICALAACGGQAGAAWDEAPALADSAGAAGAACESLLTAGSLDEILTASEHAAALADRITLSFGPSDVLPSSFVWPAVCDAAVFACRWGAGDGVLARLDGPARERAARGLRSPSDARLLLLLGRLVRERGYPVEAAGFFESAAEAGAGNTGRILAGEAREAAGDTAAAESLLARVAGDAGERDWRGRALGSLARLAVARGRGRDALARLDALKAAPRWGAPGPGDVSLLYIRAHALAGEPERASDRARSLLHFTVPVAQITAWEFLRSQGAVLDASETLAVAEAFFRSGRPAEAADLAESVTAQGVWRSAASVRAGLYRYKVRQHRLARTHFEHVLEDSGAPACDRGAALLGIARSFRSEGDTARMDVAYRRAAAEAAAPADRAEALWELAREIEEAGRREETLALYRRILQEAPEGEYAADARFAIGLVHFREGRTREALHAFANARDRAASVADRNRARVWMARGLRLRGDADSAMVLLSEAASTGGEDLYGLVAERVLHQGSVPPGGVFERVFSPVRESAGGSVGERLAAAADSTASVTPAPAVAAALAVDETAERLLDLGFTEEALVPLRRIAAACDAETRLAAATAALAGGQASFALREAEALRGVAPENARGLVQRLRFPVHSMVTVAAHAEALSLDPLFVYAVMRQESLFDPRAVSAAGARGLLQLMPATAQAEARDLGEAGPGGEALFDPTTNIRLGARHLMRLLREFGGEIPTVAAAYNAGSEKARYWRSRAEDSDVLIETIGYRETRTYVKLVLRNLLMYERLYRP